LLEKFYRKKIMVASIHVRKYRSGTQAKDKIIFNVSNKTICDI
jgi:hypothetical protein